MWLGNEKAHGGPETNGLAALHDSIFQTSKRKGWRKFFDRNAKKGLIVEPELSEELNYKITIRPDVQKPILSQFDQEYFPASSWLESLLKNGIRRIDLMGSALRRPSPPGKGILLAEDGSNLPWAVAELKRHSPERFKAWLSHVRTALPDVKTIRVVEKPEDKHRYLMLRHKDGLEVPSWTLSDGTLRLLALTVLAYSPNSNMVYLVEEPETSLHPMNIEIAMQSLVSVYEGQVLVTTQCPSVLLATQLERVLVFSRDAEIGTQIESGDHHPALRDWKGQPNLDVLFASGVLG